jgi:hypothetical protein
MSEFLLVASRPPASSQLSPAGAARELAATARFHSALRGWGLSRAFAVSDQPYADLSCCVVVRTSSRRAALAVAAAWERAAGYLVTVLPFVDTAATR